MPDDSQWCFPPDTVLPDEPPAWVQLLGEPFVNQWAELPKTLSAFDVAEDEIQLENLDRQYDHEVLGQTGVPDDNPGPFMGGITQYADRELWQLIQALWSSRGEKDPVAAAVERLGQYHESTPPEYAAEADWLANLLQEHASEVSKLIGTKCTGLLRPPQKTTTYELSQVAAMVAIRQAARSLPSDGMPRDAFVRKVAVELGYKHTPAPIAKQIDNALRAASRRRIIFTENGVIYADCQSIGDYPHDVLKKVLLQAVGRTWTTRDEAMTLTARSLGFARTGKHIKAALKSAITGLLRKGDLDRDGGQIRRA